MTMDITVASTALEWATEQAVTYALIESDSMNMLQKITTGIMSYEWIGSIQKSHVTFITQTYVPGHARVKGNERTDLLASNALMHAGRRMDKADIINNE